MDHRLEQALSLFAQDRVEVAVGGRDLGLDLAHGERVQAVPEVTARERVAALAKNLEAGRAGSKT